MYVQRKHISSLATSSINDKRKKKAIEPNVMEKILKKNIKKLESREYLREKPRKFIYTRVFALSEWKFIISNL